MKARNYINKVLIMVFLLLSFVYVIMPGFNGALSLLSGGKLSMHGAVSLAIVVFYTLLGLFLLMLGYLLGDFDYWLSTKIDPIIESIFQGKGIKKVLNNIGLQYRNDKYYYYTTQRNGFTFTISRSTGSIWVKTEHYGKVYKIDYTDNLESYIKKILNTKPELNKN